MDPAMPATKQVRGGLAVPAQRPQVPIDLLGGPAAPTGNVLPQALHGIRKPGQLTSANRAVELSGVAAMVQPPLLLPAGEPGRAAQNLLGHLHCDLVRHPPRHIGELRVEHRRRPAIGQTPRAQPAVQLFLRIDRPHVGEQPPPTAAGAVDLRRHNRTRRDRVRVIPKHGKSFSIALHPLIVGPPQIDRAESNYATRKIV
jgi:hypothetical protein